tara:strand:+ start:294 stop:422 length:129 start_codon:yes stop_codon:yes gene_type:complete
MDNYVELISTHPSLLLCLKAAAALGDGDGVACIEISFLKELQ